MNEDKRMKKKRMINVGTMKKIKKMKNVRLKRKTYAYKRETIEMKIKRINEYKNIRIIASKDEKM